MQKQSHTSAPSQTNKQITELLCAITEIWHVPRVVVDVVREGSSMESEIFRSKEEGFPAHARAWDYDLPGSEEGIGPACRTSPLPNEGSRPTFDDPA
jgi:hypothetical protein